MICGTDMINVIIGTVHDVNNILIALILVTWFAATNAVTID